MLTSTMIFEEYIFYNTFDQDLVGSSILIFFLKNQYLLTRLPSFLNDKHIESETYVMISIASKNLGSCPIKI